jgi:toxin ParE1/3/4
MPSEPRRIVWAPKADQDLRDIWRYYAHVASPEIADNVLREIGRVVAQLEDHALSWRPRDDVMPGLRSVLVHPHIVFYRVPDSIVEIVRILHQRRDFNAIFPKKRAE